MYESVFFAPRSSYIILNILYITFIGGLAFVNSDPDFGFVVGAFILYLIILNGIVFVLLLWRNANTDSYRRLTKRAFEIGLLLIVLLALAGAFVNYGYELDRITRERNEWVEGNQMYARDQDRRFNYSVPESWIRTDAQLRQDALKSNLGFALYALTTPLFVIVPMVAIRLTRQKAANYF